MDLFLLELHYISVIKIKVFKPFFMNYNDLSIFKNMINFTNSQNLIIDSAYEYPCVYEDIYISGLNENNLLVSYHPSFMQNSNGMVIGIDSRFTNFYVIDQDQNVLKKLELKWIDNCETNSPTESQKNDNHYFNLLYGSILTILIIIFVIQKIKRGSRNEST